MVFVSRLPTKSRGVELASPSPPQKNPNNRVTPTLESVRYVEYGGKDDMMTNDAFPRFPFTMTDPPTRTCKDQSDFLLVVVVLHNNSRLVVCARPCTAACGRGGEREESEGKIERSNGAVAHAWVREDTHFVLKSTRGFASECDAICTPIVASLIFLGSSSSTRLSLCPRVPISKLQL